jgi:hypothetical protein
MLSGKGENGVVDSSDGLSTILGQLDGNPPVLGQSLRVLKNLLWGTAIVEFAEQSGDGLESERVGIEVEPAAAGIKSRDEPDAHEASLDAMEVESQGIGEQGTQASAIDAQGEALLGIGKSAELAVQFREPIGERDEFGHGKSRKDWGHYEGRGPVTA